MNVYYIHRAMGDIIYSLPTIKALGGGIIYNGLPIDQHHALKPLIDVQPYIGGFFHETERGLPHGFINLENFVHLQRNPAHICESFAKLMGIKIDISEPWLSIPPRGPQSVGRRNLRYAVINVTPRYRDKVFSYRRHLNFLEDHTDLPIYFIGLEEEYKAFVSQYPNWRIRYVRIDNLLEAAYFIQDAKYFTGTQSSMLAIAEGFGRSYHYERSPFHDNCRTGRRNETILNNHTRKIHLAISRTQEIIRNFLS